MDSSPTCRIVSELLLEGAARPTRRTASTRPVVVLVLCGAFSIALALGVIALIPPNLRHHAIEQSKQQLLATATVLAWQAARELQSSDLIEAKLIEYMETLAIVSDELHARAMVGRGLHLMLKGTRPAAFLTSARLPFWLNSLAIKAPAKPDPTIATSH